MHIEIIGSTSAGKTTLARKMVQAGAKTGWAISLSDDFMLDYMHLNWIRNDFVRRRLVEAIAFVIALTRMPKYRRFIEFVVSESQSISGSWYYRLNRVRNVIRKIGIFEFIAQKAGAQQIVLADNEGILQGVHNLFVHEDNCVKLEKIARYVELIPLPDIVIYLKQKEDLLVSRTLVRGHGRVKSDPVEAAHFIRQAVDAFNGMSELSLIQDKLMIINGESGIKYDDKKSGGFLFRQVADLIHLEGV